MNWISIAVGAGAGAVAGLISSGVLRILGKSKSRWASVFHVVAVVAGLSIGREVVEPRIQSLRFEAALLEMPVYKALQQHEPAAYAKVRFAMEEGIANKVPLENIWATTRPIMSDVTAKRLPHASDEALVKFVEHAAYATTLLHSKGGNACFSYINPRPGEALDFTKLLGKDLAQEELSLLSEVVVSAAGKTRPAISEALATPDLEVVITKLQTRYRQEDFLALQSPNAPNVDKSRYCQIVADLYKEVIALPAPRNTQLLRFLMQSQ